MDSGLGAGFETKVSRMMIRISLKMEWRMEGWSVVLVIVWVDGGSGEFGLWGKNEGNNRPRMLPPLRQSNGKAGCVFTNKYLYAKLGKSLLWKVASQARSGFLLE